MKKGIIFFGLAILFSSCYYDNEEELYGLDCNLDNVTYATEINRIIETSCAVSACHDGSTQFPKYDSYQSVAQDSGKIFERVVVLKNMPPSGTLPDCDFKQIEDWLSNGTKE